MRWPEAVLLSSATSTEAAWAFIATWVARFSTPSDHSSDRSLYPISRLPGLQPISGPGSWTSAGFLPLSPPTTTRAPAESLRQPVPRPGDQDFVVDISGKPEHISVDCLNGRPVELAQPPRWGRLPVRPLPPQATPGAPPTPTLPPCNRRVLKNPGDTSAPAPVHLSYSGRAIRPPCPR